MSKEELFDRGWDITFSGPCSIVAWGAYIVHLRHPVTRRVVHGYGIDEQDALNNAAATVLKEPTIDVKKEDYHK